MMMSDWTDEKIAETINEFMSIYPPWDFNVATIAAAVKMRDDMQERITELRAENERLRSLLPSEDERIMIDSCVRAAVREGGSIIHEAMQVADWLNELEGGVGNE